MSNLRGKYLSRVPANLQIRKQSQGFIFHRQRFEILYLSSAGCYRFSDGSFMKYFNYSEMNPTLQISAPIFQEHAHCKIGDSFEFFRDGTVEKRQSDETFTLNNHWNGTVEFQVN